MFGCGQARVLIVTTKFCCRQPEASSVGLLPDEAKKADKGSHSGIGVSDSAGSAGQRNKGTKGGLWRTRIEAVRAGTEIDRALGDLC